MSRIAMEIGMNETMLGVALSVCLLVMSAATAATRGSPVVDRHDGVTSTSYTNKVTAAVMSNIDMPTGVNPNDWVAYRLVARSDGRLESIKVLGSSGNTQWNYATAAALSKTGSIPKELNGQVPASLDVRLFPARPYEF